MIESPPKTFAAYITGIALGLFAACIASMCIALLVDKYSDHLKNPNFPDYTMNVFLGMNAGNVIVYYQLPLLLFIIIVVAFLVVRSSFKWPQRPLIASLLGVLSMISVALTFWYITMMISFKWMWDNY